jgi:hypothetical protein
MTEISKRTISSLDNKVMLNYGSNSSLNPNSPTIRRDFYGNVISKRIKQHKICFADQVDNNPKQFVEIKVVNSYRNYNRNDEREQDNWSCLIY